MHAPDPVPNSLPCQPARKERTRRNPGTSLLHGAFAAALMLPGCAVAAAGSAAESAAVCSPDAPPATPRIEVTVAGARRVAGNITMTLYGANGAVFLKHHGWIALTRVPLSGTTAKACFAVSAPGTYAVAVFHDENDNHHLDTNLLGLPVEGFGFSNDAPTLIGPPSFAAARIEVHAGDNDIAIKLRY